MPKELTKRLELSFLNVFALPNASSIGFVWRISFSIPLPPPSAAKYCIAIFAVSVFPAPLSPLEKHDMVSDFYKQVVRNQKVVLEYNKSLNLKIA